MCEKHRSAAWIGIALIFLIQTVACGRTLLPWCDEAWFSSPALNLITKGYFGTSVLDPTAAFRTNDLTRIDQRTYWITPLYPLTQAAWYKIVGFSIFSLRFLSAIWGAVALVSWYFIARTLSGDERVAILTTALLAVDFQFVWSASVGRMDMMCCALGQLGLATFLYFREKNLWLAILISQACVAASGLSHPMGIGAFVG